MRLKVGDKVKFKDKRGLGWNSSGKMDKWIGQVGTISEISAVFGKYIAFKIEEDEEHWTFGSDDVIEIINVSNETTDKSTLKDEREKIIDFVNKIIDENKCIFITSEGMTYALGSQNRVAASIAWSLSEQYKEDRDFYDEIIEYLEDLKKVSK